MNNEEYRNLQSFLEAERCAGKVIYPREKDLFNAFNLTAFHKVKLVILGQDPYHGEGQAHGLSFSVPDGTKIPPSLRNIFTELHEDLGLKIPSSGNLSSWAKEGVLLLNTVLSVEASNPGSHQKMGWESFTDQIIKELSDKKNKLVFILWGAPAQKKTPLIDESKHLVIKSPHPSPLSSYRGFFGSKPFSKANAFLKQKGIDEICWDLT